MLTALAQRWGLRRCRFRPAGEVIAPREYDVEPLDETPAKAFVVAHHYAGTYPAARFRFGLYRRGALSGVAVFSVPTNPAALSVLDCPADAAAELGRFVLLDAVPGNGETWFLARCFERLRPEGLAGVISFSDPVPRPAGEGCVVFAGHIGRIYQAHNAAYLGRSKARTHRLLPDGRILSPRALQKLRARERGWRYVLGQLLVAGAPAPTGDMDGWLWRWLPVVTRPFRHSGNHKYAWGLCRAVRRSLPPSLPYPKVLG